MSVFHEDKGFATQIPVSERSWGNFFPNSKGARQRLYAVALRP